MDVSIEEAARIVGRIGGCIGGGAKDASQNIRVPHEWKARRHFDSLGVE